MTDASAFTERQTRNGRVFSAYQVPIVSVRTTVQSLVDKRHQEALRRGRTRTRTRTPTQDVEPALDECSDDDAADTDDVYVRPTSTRPPPARDVSPLTPVSSRSPSPASGEESNAAEDVLLPPSPSPTPHMLDELRVALSRPPIRTPAHPPPASPPLSHPPSTTDPPSVPPSTQPSKKSGKRKRQKDARKERALAGGAAPPARKRRKRLDGRGGAASKGEVKQRAKQYLLGAGSVEAEYANEGGTWQGPRTDWDPRVFTLDEVRTLVDRAFRKLNWKGVTPTVVLDENGRLMVVLVGCPSDSNWAELMKRAAELLRVAQSKLHFDVEHTHHRRGDYPTLGFGLSFGGGRVIPGWIDNDPRNVAILEALLEEEPFKKMIEFTNKAFKLYFPEMWKEYEHTLDKIVEEDSNLRRPFGACPFAAAHFNFGPSGWTRLHTDHLNRVGGMCSIWPLEDFDPTKGGHLILWDLRLVIEFPPGNLILLPSALIKHGNISVCQGESRSAFVMFSAAGLFRWVLNGGQSDREFKESASEEDWEAWVKWRKEMPARNLDLFPVWTDLVKENM